MLRISRLPARVLALLLLSVAAAEVGYAQANRFERVDAHALAAPVKIHRDVQKLARYLAIPAQTDEEKARAIYRWITQNIAYDTKSFFDGGIKTYNAQQVLKRRVAICDGYATLFTALGSAMGLEVISVAGYAKGYGTGDGHRFPEPNHAWNAVRIGGAWKLIDSTWGSGEISPERSFVRKFKPYYFFTDPEALIFTHLPVEKQWQLVAAPLEKAEFEARRYVPHGTFSLGFSPDEVRRVQQKGAPVITAFEVPGVELRVSAAPAEAVLTSGRKYRFSFRAPAEGVMNVVNAGRWTEMTRSGDRLELELLPEKGTVDILFKTPTQAEPAVVLRYQVK